MLTDISPAFGIALLVFIGFVLGAAEIIIPGGVLGLVAAAVLFAAVVWGYVAYGFFVGSVLGVCLLVVAFVAFIVWMYTFPNSYFGKKMSNLDHVVDSPEQSKYDVLLGKTGTALTDLRPSGLVLFDSRRVDVVSEAAYIKKNETVVVTEVEGSRVAVRRVANSEN
ncbi:MAG: NfeD family protein [Chthoniobacterales bacterium]